MWWFILQLIGVKSVAAAVVRLGMTTALIGAAVAGMYALGFDPISLVWGWLVDLLEAAIKAAFPDSPW